MSNNNNRLKNAMTLNWLKGNENVYRIYNPNHSRSQLVNRNTLLKYVESNRVQTLRQLHRLVTRVNADLGKINRYSEVIQSGARRGPNVTYSNLVNLPAFQSPNVYYQNTRPLNNYVFNKFGNERGRLPVRNPIYGGNLKLKNIKANKLSATNRRQLRKRKRNEERNAAAERENMMRRARANAAQRANQRRQQNTRAARLTHLWYVPELGIFNSNGQHYGTINNIRNGVTINNRNYIPVRSTSIPMSARTERNTLRQRFGWNHPPRYLVYTPRNIPRRFWFHRPSQRMFSYNGAVLPYLLPYVNNNRENWGMETANRAWWSVRQDNLRGNNNSEERRNRIMHEYGLPTPPELLVEENA